jgi:CDP-diglyceride synthetase
MLNVAMCLQSILLVDPAEKVDSMNLLLWMAPMAFVLLIPVVAVLEPSRALDVVQRLQFSPDFRGLLLCNCLLAFFANLLNFLIIRATSALTLQVCFLLHFCFLCDQLWSCATHP